eukprot:g32440.t1
MRCCRPSTAAKLYSSTISNFMAQHISYSTVTIKPGAQAWYNGECRRACQEQNQAYLKMRYQPAELFQYSYNTGIYPTMWKTAQVCPINKRQDKYNLANYC